MNEFLAESRKCFYNGKTKPKADLTDPHIWWNTFSALMEAGLIK